VEHGWQRAEPAFAARRREARGDVPPAAASAGKATDLQQTVGNAATTRLRIASPQTAASAPMRVGAASVAPPGSAASTPWPGVIKATWNAALRRTPAKDEENPYAGIIADLPRGTRVTVTGSEHGWLSVQLELDGRKLAGYVSRELVEPAAPVAALPEAAVKPTSVGEAFLMLKRYELKRSGVPRWNPSGIEQDEIHDAIGMLEDTGRYVVDRADFKVWFRRTAPVKHKIDSIEDFILFTETVERAYPKSSAAEVAGTIRRLWFRGENWGVLVNSPGIKDSGGDVSLKTEPDPFAVAFDMADLVPKGGKKIKTRLGEVDIAHVITGIDAALSGSPASNPLSGGDSELKWKTLRAADKGDPRDFATWSGDIGQAYAEYLVERYVNNNSSASLKKFVDDKASPDQLLADIHGYIAVAVWKSVPAKANPAGGELKVSNVLRTLYLTDKAGVAVSYESYLEAVSGKTPSELRDFVIERSLAFARVWYAPKMRAARNLVAGRYGFSKEEILKEAMGEFDDKHAENEKSAAKGDKLGDIIDSFIVMLKGNVK
jgi:hypothetical protein